MSTTQAVECVVVGAGVVGLAVARALALAGHEVLVLEAEAAIGTGTSSRNSEVIHAGIYYPTGSLKARLCVQGKQQLYRYCTARRIRHQRIGKLIVACMADELPVLEAYRVQAQRNGVSDLRWVEAAELAVLEPEVQAVRALLSPSTGIIDSHELMLSLQGELEAAGGDIALRSPVQAIHAESGGFRIRCADAERTQLHCRRLVNSAGLQAIRLAQAIDGLPAECVPPGYFAKGHYYALSGRAPFRHLVYPVATGGGLGVHVTLDLAGAVRFGPDLRWVADLDYGFDDSRRAEFIAAIRRYYPGLDATRLQPAYTGIRPKITGPGEPAADFMIQGPAAHGVPGLVNLFGIESPGLTAALAIAEEVAGRLEQPV